MEVWHGTQDAPRAPKRIAGGEPVAIHAGTWPIEIGQAVSVRYRVEPRAGAARHGEREAFWQENRGPNSHWRAELGPFADGDLVTYTVAARGPHGARETAESRFRVGPKVYLGLLWHHHQPLYEDTLATSPRGCYAMPWVRLHAIRDYYGMALLLAEQPDVHVTIDLTPVLCRQLAGYLERGATDRQLELTLTPAERLTERERAIVLEEFFQADLDRQVRPHPRYRELLEMRRSEVPFADQDIRDLQMWWNLAWFGHELRVGEVRLVTGEKASVRRFVEKQRGFAVRDLEDMVEEQRKVMRAVVPIHRALADRGQVELAASALCHPILPLLIDTDEATIDRPGATWPPRFAYPEDAEAQVALGLADARARFGQTPLGMWPPEGAVSPAVVPVVARAGVRWIATDRAVLARSGDGHDVEDPDVLARPWRAVHDGYAVSAFFRDTALSDAIGFRYGAAEHEDAAVRDFLAQLEDRFISRFAGDDDRLVPVILDGENCWGGYADDGRPFLRALYRALAGHPHIRTVTFSEYLLGNPARGVAPHPLEEQPRLERLHTASWVDERGSVPGHELGTWIGEEEENRGWALLGVARRDLAAAGATPESAPRAFEALYAAEGSDWFWWFGDDQDSGHDHDFDALFRMHVANIYRALGREPPAEVGQAIVAPPVDWQLGRAQRLGRAEQLVVRARCPGRLRFWLDDGPATEVVLAPVGGAMAGTTHHLARLGPFAGEARVLRFRFACEGGSACVAATATRDPLCDGAVHEVELAG